MLAKKEWNEQDKIHKATLKNFRSTASQGVWIDYLGKKFIVRKNVFRPYMDSIALARKLIIKKGETVADVGTGSGLLAILALYKGAKKAVALDINPAAVRNARENAKIHGFSKTMDVRLSNMFDAVKENEEFDIVLANLPYRNKTASDVVEMSMWDTNFEANRKFFAGLKRVLKTNGRAYMAQSNYGLPGEIKRLARKNGFRIKKIGEKRDRFRIFYAYEIKHRNFRE